AVSTTSGSSPRRAASSRPTWATSSEWVSRLRAKSSPAVGLSTCVFTASRRSADECRMRARSRAKSPRRLECCSGSRRSASASPYPGVESASATAVAQLGLGELGPVGLLQVAAVEPPLRERGRLRAARATARPLGVLPRVRLRPVEPREQLVDLVEARRLRERRPQFAAHGVALEVPRDVLADVAAAPDLV